MLRFDEGQRNNVNIHTMIIESLCTTSIVERDWVGAVPNLNRCT